MKLEIITPKGIELEQEADQVVLPTRTGQITVLPRHIPLISVLKAGRMKITSNNNQIEREIEGGIAQISADKVSILLKKF